MNRQTKPRLQLRKSTVKVLTSDHLGNAAGASGYLLCNLKTLICTFPPPTLQPNCLTPTQITICAC